MPSPRRRRATIALLTAALAAPLSAAVPFAGHVASASGNYTKNCPKPESLVVGTTWHSHRLARGVVLKEGRHADSRGYVSMHVLTLDLTQPGVSLGQLRRKLAMRTPLTSLAAGRSRLVAATNTGYFDFATGAPAPAIVNRRKVLVGRSTPASVVAIDTDGRIRAGKLALAGTVTSSGQSQMLVGMNVLWPYNGLTIYTKPWGTARFEFPDDAVSRYVDKGVITSGTGRYQDVPGSGYLLVARGQTAVDWVRSLKRGAPITITHGLSTDIPRRIAQAYGVGAQIVTTGGVARTNLSCRRAYPMPARTVVGLADGGRRMILLVVEDHPGTDMHGLDANQAARVIADLGANQAFLFDGSGSTEMLARMPRHPERLSLRNYTADGQERPIPIGLGVYYRP